jgi:type II secretory ATPase GspE/PulE/Tfp pilus assembly ATPase PilB-like protein
MGQEINYTGGLPGILDGILNTAIENRASDVHFDPKGDGLNIRMRVDGILYPIELKTYAAEQIISRIKVLAQMNIAEHRIPQDGEFEFECQGKKYDVRVSTAATIYGEAIVLRILDRDAAFVGLENLGLDPDQLEEVKRLIASPYGMVIASGPTGSGKTTFLYSALGTFDKTAKNIITIEDPVEFPVEGIRQIQVDEGIGLGFAKSMHGILRQDPNIIMLGEVRDADTAQLAFQAALTGMLVFSTFHTFDVTGLVIRLIEMGVPRSVVAHALSGVISIRLVRKICLSCEEPYELTEFEKRILIVQDNDGKSLKKGKGCDLCHHSGYLGRVGIYEVLVCDDEIRWNIIERTSSSDLRAFIKTKMNKSLLESGRQKVMDGITTAEEIIRVVGTL